MAAAVVWGLWVGLQLPAKWLEQDAACAKRALRDGAMHGDGFRAVVHLWEDSQQVSRSESLTASVCGGGMGCAGGGETIELV